MIMTETDMGTSCAITTGDITIAVTVEAVACANTTGSVPNADNVLEGLRRQNEDHASCLNYNPDWVERHVQ